MLCNICGGGQEIVVLLFNSSPSSKAYFFSRKRRTTFRTEHISVSSRSNVFIRLAHPRQIISSSDMTTIYLQYRRQKLYVAERLNFGYMKYYTLKSLIMGSTWSKKKNLQCFVCTIERNNCYHLFLLSSWLVWLVEGHWFTIQHLYFHQISNSSNWWQQLQCEYEFIFFVTPLKNTS